MACSIRLGLLCAHLKSLVGGGPERVGYLFGRRSGSSLEASTFYPARNIKGSPVEFEADPFDTVVAHAAAEKYGWELVAVFHTHPCGRPAPSQLDLRGMAMWPYVWVIATPSGMAAFKLEGGRLSACKIEC